MIKHMMIDLETLGTSNDAAIASIGYCVFDETGINLMGGRVVNLFSSIVVGGGVVDEDTIEWWRKQSSEAILPLSEGDPIDISSALEQMFITFEKNMCECVWAKGPTFDITIVERYARRLDLRIPWKYNNHRDYRTLINTAVAIGWERPEKEVSHIAPFDASDQAEDVISAFSFLKAMIK